ncbi:MAG: carboxypeptidase-like regulatory domain-containing protein, partial [Anaerolineae bacterium]
MPRPPGFHALVAALMLAALLLALPWQSIQGQGARADALLVGAVFDRQQQPVADARVTLRASNSETPLAETTTQADGRYALAVPPDLPTQLAVHVEREHFQPTVVSLDAAAIASLQAGQAVALPDALLLRRVTLSFWIATLIFAGMLVLIALGRQHNTLAAQLGMAAIFAVS